MLTSACFTNQDTMPGLAPQHEMAVGPGLPCARLRAWVLLGNRREKYAVQLSVQREDLGSQTGQWRRWQLL